MSKHQRMRYPLGRDDAMALLALVMEEGPVPQSDVSKVLGLDSRRTSKLVSKLEKEGSIRRERVLRKGRWTFLLIPSKEVQRTSVQLGSIEGAPCLGCVHDNNGECFPGGPVDPSRCPLEAGGFGLAQWVLQCMRDRERAIGA